MKDEKPMSAGEPEDRRPGGGPERRRGGPRKQHGFVQRATAAGHSGTGSESVRPHLRDQLKLKALLPTPYPTPPEPVENGNKDEHHR